MKEAERFVEICGMVGHHSERITGNSIVDAYFGPSELAPESQDRHVSSDTLIHELQQLLDECRDQIVPELRLDYLLGEMESMQVLVRWLTGEEMSFAELVEGLFGIQMSPFSESELDAATNHLRDLLSDHPGHDLKEKVNRFDEEGRMRGEELKDLIMGELQRKARDVGAMFRKRVFSLVGEDVTDNGVRYETVQSKPWSGYNYYQGNYSSLNCFNVDRPFNSDNLLNVVYHEYEHHVSNLWREKAYNQNGWTELSIVPLHTGRCVISEGTADTAKEFLRISEENPRKEIIDALYALRRMVSINAAIMLNHERKSLGEVAEFISDGGLRPRKEAEKSLDFIRPQRNDGRPNLWAPYVFNYFVGRKRFVLPTFKKAETEGELKRFFQTVYLNPFSLSSRTWSKAFEWL